jgi:hypothetical protein
MITLINDLANFARGKGDKDKVKRKQRNSIIRNSVLGTALLGGLSYLALKGKGIKSSINVPKPNTPIPTQTVNKKQKELQNEIEKLKDLKNKINNPETILSDNNLPTELSKPNVNAEQVGRTAFKKQVRDIRQKNSNLKAKPIKPDKIVASGNIGNEYKQITYDDLKNYKKLEELAGDSQQAAKWLKEIKKQRSKKIQERVFLLQQASRRRLAEKYGVKKADKIINDSLSNDLYKTIGVKPKRGYSQLTSKSRKKARSRIAKLIARREVIDTDAYYTSVNKLATFARNKGSKDKRKRKLRDGRTLTPNKPIAANDGVHKKIVLASKLVDGKKKYKVIRFGAIGYGHNYSPEARKNYLARSGGIKNKSGQLTKDDKFSANWWSRKNLWSRNTKPSGTGRFAN